MPNQAPHLVIQNQSTENIRQKYDLLVEISDNLERLRFDQQRLQNDIPPETYQELQDFLGTDKEIESAEQIIIHSLQKVAQMIDYPEIEQAKADGVLSEYEAEDVVRIMRESELLQVRSSKNHEKGLER